MENITYRYMKDGQERVVTGTQEEIDAEKAGAAFQSSVTSAECNIRRERSRRPR